MLRTLILAFATGILLAGCNFNLNIETEKDTNNVISVDDVGSQDVALAALGEACGSKIETLCGENLFCEYSPGKVTGICAPKAVNPDIVCDKEKAPVCAQKGRQRLGYLNECEARRHGAEILNKGFCEVVDVAGSCAVKLHSVGNCAGEFSGAEFNKTENECILATTRGCDGQIPFVDKASCEAACIQ